MTGKTLAFILFSVSLSAISQITMKAGMSGRNIQQHYLSDHSVLGTLQGALTNGYVMSGLMLYGVSALSWLYVLAGTDVSKAYPFVGLGFIFTMLLGWIALDESISGGRIVGTLLVVSGVILVART